MLGEIRYSSIINFLTTFGEGGISPWGIPHKEAKVRYLEPFMRSNRVERRRDRSHQI